MAPSIDGRAGAIWRLTVIAVVTLEALTQAASITDQSDPTNQSCYYYNSSECQNDTGEKFSSLDSSERFPDIPNGPPENFSTSQLASLPNRCIFKERCHTSNLSDAAASSNVRSGQHACYVVWSNNTSTNNKPVIKNMGCYYQPMHIAECDVQACVDKNGRQHRFCCCQSNLCNINFSSNHTVVDPVIDPTKEIESSTLWTASIMITLGMMASIMGLFVFNRVRRCKQHSEFQPANQDNYINLPFSSIHEERGDEISVLNNEEHSDEIDLDKLQMEKLLAAGRFGKVWKANTEHRVSHTPINVAVKIFNAQERDSWNNECRVYRLPYIEHDNILKFFCSKSHLDGDEFWIVTEYHERGSLHDYLRDNTLSIDELLFVVESIANGMNFLHEEVNFGKDGTPSLRKPSIAHRDFKSKNVLLKNDLTPCIADFGLACIFYPDQPISNNQELIGTCRYMAPEILQGSIDFTVDSFKRMDMYAFSLIMWEMLTRCKMNNMPEVSPYKLPYEAELGPAPENYQITEFVAMERRRPVLKDEWRDDPILKEYCQTVVECWDNDAVARLTASCVYDRLSRWRQSSSLPSC